MKMGWVFGSEQAALETHPAKRLLTQAAGDLHYGRYLRFLHLARLIDKELQRNLGARVLDAGCGVGSYSVFLARRGAEVMGIDADTGVVERDQQMAARLGLPNLN